MRRVALIAAIGVFLLSAFAHAESTVPAAGPTGFMAWALSKSNDFDSNWMRMTEQKTSAAAPSLLQETQAPAMPADVPLAQSTWPSLEDRTSKGTKLSHRIVDSWSFVHTVGGDFQFMQGLARERSGPARGVTPLEHPASARLNVPYDVLRPQNSPIQQKQFIRSIGDVSRPRLTSFGRVPAPGQRGLNTTPARPYYQAARPRML
jgi:hypothetical protein